MKTPSLIVALLISGATALAVDPPPDGGYPNQNTAEGEDALFSLTTGYDNTALGFHALYTTTSSSSNTGVGWQALLSNTTGSNNTAIGWNALAANTVASNNTATGVQALLNTTSGEANTANGVSALYSNTTGGNNTAIGSYSLLRNVTGNENTAAGFSALLNNRDGSSNTAVGYFALANTEAGSNNIAVGYTAGFFRQTGSDNIDIGNEGAPRESKTIRIGARFTHRATYLAGVSGATVPAGVAVVVDSNGHLGTVTSSVRYKENIQPLEQASEAIFSLQPVAFRYKKELDEKGVPQFGLLAEEVAKIAPDLVACDEAGQPYAVRYDAVNTMLLNEFIKEHRKVEEQAGKIERLEAQLEAVSARLEAKGL